MAIRYPRGGVDPEGFSFEKYGRFVPGAVKKLAPGKDVVIFTFGDMVETARRVRELLGERGIRAAIVNLLTIKPLDVRGIERELRAARYAVTLENGAASGGAGDISLRLSAPRSAARSSSAPGSRTVSLRMGPGRSCAKSTGWTRSPWQNAFSHSSNSLPRIRLYLLTEMTLCAIFFML